MLLLLLLDLDECRHNEQACAQNARCENSHGSFRCICKEGFVEQRDGSATICQGSQTLSFTPYSQWLKWGGSQGITDPFFLNI